MFSFVINLEFAGKKREDKKFGKKTQSGEMTQQVDTCHQAKSMRFLLRTSGGEGEDYPVA